MQLCTEEIPINIQQDATLHSFTYLTNSCTIYL